MLTLGLSLLVLFIILGILAIASYQDIKSITISREIVIALYILVPVYLYIRDVNYATAGFCFLFTLVTFLCLWFISRKGFGFGDVLVIAALGWMIADFTILRVFLISMGVFSIPWGLFWLWRYKRNPDLEHMWTGKKTEIQTKDLKPGMVLAEDGFMQGLTDKQIKKIKKENRRSIFVKKPMPFIPVVFFTLLYVTVLISLFPMLQFI